MAGHLEGSPFTGAYYRKVECPLAGDIFGIRAEAILPQVEIVPDRFFVEPENRWDHFRTGPLDRPSFYLGGNSNGKELDAGLCWDRVYDPTGRATLTDRENLCDGGDPKHRFLRFPDGRIVNGYGEEIASGLSSRHIERLYRPNFAFRPYYRTTNHFLRPKETLWNNPKPGTVDNVYFYPGERVAMAVKAVGPEEARLDVRLDSTEEKRAYAHSFRMEGFGLGAKHRFKRVNAIDQFLIIDNERHGNERRAVIPTRARAVGGRWVRVELLGHDFKPLRALVGDDLITTVPEELLAYLGTIFGVADADEFGGETVSIDPGARVPVA